VGVQAAENSRIVVNMKKKTAMEQRNRACPHVG
jgi:hypothetical protein